MNSLELVPVGWNVWREAPPPRSTWVHSLREADAEPELVLTCKRGCCVHTRMGCGLLGSYWRIASREEYEGEQREWERLDKLDRLAGEDALDASCP